MEQNTVSLVTRRSRIYSAGELRSVMPAEEERYGDNTVSRVTRRSRIYSAKGHRLVMPSQEQIYAA
jgi:hypothetical protein